MSRGIDLADFAVVDGCLACPSGSEADAYTRLELDR